MPQHGRRKRTRSLLDVVASVDDLLGVAPTYDTKSDDDNDADTAERSAMSSENEETVLDIVGADRAGAAALRQHKVVRDATDAFEASSSNPLDSFSWQNSGSLGGTEMSLLNRKEEELADMAFFLVETLQRVCSAASLLALVQHVATHGVRPVLMALKHAGTQPRFFQILSETPAKGRRRALVLKLFSLLFAACDQHRELFCCESVVRFLVHCLKTNADPTQTTTEGVGSDVGATTTKTEAAEAPTKSKAPVVRGAHWSSARRKTPPTCAPETRVDAEKTDTEDDEVEAVLNILAAASPVATSSSPSATSSLPTPFLCALQVLTDLMLAENQHRGMDSVSRFFVHFGGLDVLCAHLEACVRAAPSTSTSPRQRSAAGSVEDLRVLTLLEVLTVSGRLPRGPDSVLPRLTSAVFAFMDCLAPASSLSTWAACADEAVVSVVNASLRVLTNITNVDAAAVLQSGVYRYQSQALAHWLSSALTHATHTASTALPMPAAHIETHTFALCCAINLVKYEAKHVSSAAASFTSALVWSSVPDTAKATADHPREAHGALGDGVPMPILTSLATRMFAWYVSEATELTVLSGYCALLLAVISLVHDDPDDVLAVVAPLNLRVRVLTAVADAARASTMQWLADDEKTPMTLVVVILQEFLLFQSTAGTLTREGLVEMAAIAEQLVAAHHIEVTVEAPDHSP